MPLRGEDKGQLRAEPDTQEGCDTYPGRYKDEQAWRADYAPVAHRQRIYAAPIYDLPDPRHKRHAKCYDEISNSKYSKGETVKTIPGKSSHRYTCRQSSTGSEFIKAHEAHATFRILSGIISKVAEDSGNLHRRRNSGQYLQTKQVGQGILGRSKKEQPYLYQTQDWSEGQEETASPTVAERTHNRRERQFGDKKGYGEQTDIDIGNRTAMT